MFRFANLILILLTPLPVLAAPRTLSEFVNTIVSILNGGAIVLVTLALAVYFFGISTNLLKIKDDEATMKRYFFWGIIVLFVMVSLWGILNLVQNTIFGGSFDTGSGRLPNSEGYDPFGNVQFE